MSRPVTEKDQELIAHALEAEGGHLSIGHAGFTLFWKEGWLSGYVADELKQACVERGLPVIDNRGVSFDDLVRIVISGPMIAVGRPADPAPWHALSHAPLAVVAAACRRAGAEVHNIPEANLSDALDRLDGCKAFASTGDKT